MKNTGKIIQQAKHNVGWEEKVVVKCLHIKMSHFVFQFQHQTFYKLFNMVELILEDLWLWLLPVRHHIHEGWDKREPLSPIIGNKTMMKGIVFTGQVAWPVMTGKWLQSFAVTVMTGYKQSQSQLWQFLKPLWPIITGHLIDRVKPFKMRYRTSKTAKNWQRYDQKH